MGLRVDIDAALAAAQDEGDAVGTAALRLAQCAIRDRDRSETSANGERGCEDALIVDILKQMIEQCEAQAKDYEESGRPDLAEQERDEAEVLRGLLPRPMDEATLRELANTVIRDLGASGLKDVGRAVGEMKCRAGSRLDPMQAKAVVQALLAH